MGCVVPLMCSVIPFSCLLYPRGLSGFLASSRVACSQLCAEMCAAPLSHNCSHTDSHTADDSLHARTRLGPLAAALWTPPPPTDSPNCVTTVKMHTPQHCTPFCLSVCAFICKLPSSPTHPHQLQAIRCATCTCVRNPPTTVRTTNKQHGQRNTKLPRVLIALITTTPPSSGPPQA